MNRDSLKRKLHSQKVRNCISKPNGVEIVRIRLGPCRELSVEQKYFPYIYSLDKEPDSILSCHASEQHLMEWIQLQTGLQPNTTYYFRCSGVWVEIRLNVIETGIKSLWNHAQYWGQQHSHGFLFVDEPIEHMVEVGFDSRDEYNYFYDRYLLITDDNAQVVKL